MEVSHNTHGSSSFLELNPVDRTSCPGAVLRPDLKKSLMPEHCYLAILNNSLAQRFMRWICILPYRSTILTDGTVRMLFQTMHVRTLLSRARACDR
jgi:hypothetical protein